MITSEEIALYIQKIPAAPAVVQEALNFARAGDLTKASKSASEDPALKLYLKTLINRPIYGFRNEVSDVAQIFGILGLGASQQTLYNYLLSLLTPKRWALFDLTNHQFYDLQASISKHWEAILTHLKITDKEIQSAISLVPASIIVCESLFASRKAEVAQLRSVKALDYNTILFRISGSDLFDISSEIAHKWEMPPSVVKLIRSASGVEQDLSDKERLLAKWMHLLLFYELSQPAYISAGLNDFIDFKIDFVQDIYESFAQVVQNT
ncbi:MAG TPA: HDOD domain-containing protein [Sulfuricurvum sp.]|nr:HDOD domain-containing protein [Sulfuricurvum sp.]